MVTGFVEAAQRGDLLARRLLDTRDRSSVFQRPRGHDAGCEQLQDAPRLCGSASRPARIRAAARSGWGGSPRQASDIFTDCSISG